MNSKNRSVLLGVRSRARCSGFDRAPGSHQSERGRGRANCALPGAMRRASFRALYTSCILAMVTEYDYFMRNRCRPDVGGKQQHSRERCRIISWCRTLTADNGRNRRQLLIVSFSEAFSLPSVIYIHIYIYVFYIRSRLPKRQRDKSNKKNGGRCVD